MRESTARHTLPAARSWSIFRSPSARHPDRSGPLLKEHLWREVWEIDRIEEFRSTHSARSTSPSGISPRNSPGLPLYKVHRRSPGSYPRLCQHRHLPGHGGVSRCCRPVPRLWVPRNQAACVGRPRKDAQLGQDAARTMLGPTSPDVRRFGRVRFDRCDLCRPRARGGGVLWYEEPMREFDIDAYRRLAQSGRYSPAFRGNKRRRAFQRRRFHRYRCRPHGAHQHPIQRRYHGRPAGGTPGGVVQHAGRGARWEDPRSLAVGVRDSREHPGYESLIYSNPIDVEAGIGRMAPSLRPMCRASDGMSLNKSTPRSSEPSRTLDVDARKEEKGSFPADHVRSLRRGNAR